MKTLMVPTLNLDSSGTADVICDVMRWQPAGGKECVGIQ